MTDVLALAREERVEFADFLATLTPQQWDAPTLCTGWRVRDLVAHVIGWDGQGLTGFAWNLARARFSGNRANQRVVESMRGLDPPALVSLVRRHETPEGLTALFGYRIALTDGVIHQQDIRRPLGRPREISGERLRVILDFAMFAPPIGAAGRIRGLCLVATDLDWSHGKGTEVTGPGEALLMAAAGRADALDELEGPGRDVLASRLR